MNRWITKAMSLLLAFSLLLPAYASTASAQEATTTSAAADLRVGFDQLLGEHAMLAIIAMQKGYDGAADFGAAANALNDNTLALTAAMTKLFGAEAGQQFQTMWSAHIGFFVDYVKATAAKDEAGRQAALAKLAKYKEDFSAFLAGATKLPASALADGLQMHVNQLVGAFDSYVNKDYPSTYKYMREAYAHMFMTGDTLAGAISKAYPDKVNMTTANNPAVDLRVTLDRLLAEHAELAVLAMQKGVDGSADFGAVAAALANNTSDLSGAIASVFGKDAGNAFQTMWSAHIGFFVDYVKATAAKDSMGRQAALDQLAKYKEDFAAFLAGATKLPASALADGLQMHVNQLIGAFDGYVNKDYPTAYTNIREAYAHMFMTGDALASAIVALDPSKYQDSSVNASTKVWFKIGSNVLDLNGTDTVMDTKPFIAADGHAYISLRYLAEAIGAQVSWDNDKQAAIVKTGGNTAVFWIGHSDMELNGMSKDIGSQVILKDDRTQVPLRFIAELLGWNVQWNDADWSISLTQSANLGISAHL